MKEGVMPGGVEPEPLIGSQKHQEDVIRADERADERMEKALGNKYT